MIAGGAAFRKSLRRSRASPPTAVPVPIPTTDGRLFADGLVVMTYGSRRELPWRHFAQAFGTPLVDRRQRRTLKSEDSSGPYGLTRTDASKAR
jgi:hypothetical protein